MATPPKKGTVYKAGYGPRDPLGEVGQALDAIAARVVKANLMLPIAARKSPSDAAILGTYNQNLIRTVRSQVIARSVAKFGHTPTTKEVNATLAKTLKAYAPTRQKAKDTVSYKVK
jgi:hypothetical protein